jgi:hypothetical protein
MHLLLLKEKNESINRLRRGGSLSGFCGRTGFHELRRRIDAVNHKGVFDKMHQSNWGEKRI